MRVCSHRIWTRCECRSLKTDPLAAATWSGPPPRTGYTAVCCEIVTYGGSERPTALGGGQGDPPANSCILSFAEGLPAGEGGLLIPSPLTGEGRERRLLRYSPHLERAVGPAARLSPRTPGPSTSVGTKEDNPPSNSLRARRAPREGGQALTPRRPTPLAPARLQVLPACGLSACSWRMAGCLRRGRGGSGPPP